jgi:hypothetical protein
MRLEHNNWTTDFCRFPDPILEQVIQLCIITGHHNKLGINSQLVVYSTHIMLRDELTQKFSHFDKITVFG